MVKVSGIRAESKMGNNDSGSGTVCTRRNLWLTLIGCCFAVGCTTIKKAGIVAGGAALGATAGTVLSGGVTAPILGAMTTAFVVDAATEISRSGDNMDCASDNFWSVVGNLISIGGWGLILIILVPMILGWILPGPLEKKKKS